jgi:hypothetical protein
VHDFGYPEKYSTATIVVSVTDVNDNVPIFVKSEVSLSIPENTEQLAIHQLVAKDQDAGDNGKLSYAIIGTYHPTKLSYVIIVTYHPIRFQTDILIQYIPMYIRCTGGKIRKILYPVIFVK